MLSRSGCTKVIGVFGYPVEHSLSPAMHNAAITALGLHYIYIPFSVLPDNVGPAIRSLLALGIIGVNLTIPHKERALSFLDSVAPEAETVGAVNTIHNDRGRLIGYNTDGEGFSGPLKAMGFDLCGKRAVALGAGGAARSVAHRLALDGARMTIVNRTPERAARLAAEVNHAAGAEVADWLYFGDEEGVTRALAGADLLVNATSVGMSPQDKEMPAIPPGSLRSDLLVYDLIYSPVETRLLAEARAAGARTLNGLPMLVYQGAAAFRIWTGIAPPVDVMAKAIGCPLSKAGRPEEG